jgi:hypothetical protein
LLVSGYTGKFPWRVRDGLLLPGPLVPGPFSGSWKLIQN